MLYHGVFRWVIVRFDESALLALGAAGIQEIGHGVLHLVMGRRAGAGANSLEAK